MKKINKFLLTGIIACTLASVGVGAGFIINNNDSNDPVNDNENLITEVINSNKLNVKKVKAGLDSNNLEYITFSYSIEPEGCEEEIKCTALFSSGADASDTLDVSIDSTAKTITVTCKQAFSKQIILDIAIANDSSIHTEITIDYKQRVTGVSFSDTTSGYDFDFATNGIGGYTCNLIDYIKLELSEVYTVAASNLTPASVEVTNISFNGDADPIWNLETNVYRTLFDKSDAFFVKDLGSILFEEYFNSSICSLEIDSDMDEFLNKFCNSYDKNYLIELDNSYSNGEIDEETSLPDVSAIPYLIEVKVLGKYNLDIPFHLSLFDLGIIDLELSATGLSAETTKLIFK